MKEEKIFISKMYVEIKNQWILFSDFDIKEIRDLYISSNVGWVYKLMEIIKVIRILKKYKKKHNSLNIWVEYKSMDAYLSN